MQSDTDYAVCMLDLHGQVTSLNASTWTFGNLQPSEILGNDFSSLYRGQGGGECVAEFLLKNARNSGLSEKESWLFREDGVGLRIKSTLNQMVDHTGAVAGFVLTVRGIAPKKHPDGALSASEERFRLLVQSVTDYAIYMLDTEGHVTSWNAGAERFKLYTASEITGKHFSQFYTAQDREDDVPRLALETAKVEGRFEAEGWRVRKDGSQFWASVVIEPIRNGQGELIGFAKVTRDLTEKRGIEEQLHQSQKMEAVGQLTGGLAHDFNNLLAGLSGSLEMMQVRLQQGRTVDFERYHAAAQGAVKRAAALTQRLLAFSRRHKLDPKPTMINALLDDLAELIRRTVGAGTAVEVVAARDLWTTLIDANQLENVVLNLCINGRDAMPYGGTLTIETSNCVIDHRLARLYDLPAGDYVQVRVTDTGSGIPDDILPKIFDPFFTTKPVGAGTGLGLSMTYGFVRQSDGQVRVKTEVGKGTTITLYLPRHEDAPIVEETNARVLCSSPFGHGKTVLVIEDEATIRMLISEVLEELGFDVIEAADGPSGLRVVKSASRIDLMITDVGLPGGMNGNQVAEAARDIRSSLKILFITGYAENSVMRSDEFERGAEILTKPFEMDTLAERVKAIISVG